MSTASDLDVSASEFEWNVAPSFTNKLIMNFGMIVCSALMIWKTLMIFTNTESPVVVVLS